MRGAAVLTGKTCRTTNLLETIFVVGVAWIAAMILMTSCAVITPAPSRKTGGVIWGDKTPSDVLSELQQAQQKIRNFTTAFSISLTPPAKGRPSHLQGVLFFQKTGAAPNLRIRGLGLFGRMIFDLVQSDGQTQLYIPARKTLYRGPIQKDADPWGDTFSAMFADFSKTTVKKNQPLLPDADRIRLDLDDGYLLFDKTTGRLQTWQQPDQTIIYGQYLHHEGRPAVPTHIQVMKNDGSQKATCTLSQIHINTEEAFTFDLSRYSPKTILNISELNTIQP